MNEKKQKQKGKMRYMFWKCGAWRYLKMTDERSSSSILRKTISEPLKGIEPATF